MPIITEPSCYLHMVVLGKVEDACLNVSGGLANRLVDLVRPLPATGVVGS